MGFNLVGTYGAAFIAGSVTILAAARAGWTGAAPLLLCATLMARHVRFCPLFAMAAAPALETPIARLFPRFARRSSAPKAATRKATTIALGVACLATLLVVSLEPRPVPAPSMAPAAALDAAGPSLMVVPNCTLADCSRRHGTPKGTRAMRRSLLNEYDVSWALVVPGTEAVDKLRRSAQWKEIFQDGDAELFVRN
jgi:hypothetical protein